MSKLSRLKFGKFENSFGASDDEPIRAELFSVERLEQFAEVLAAEQTEVAQPKIFRKLLPRLEDNGKILKDAYRSLADAVGNEQIISPAAGWLVDNFHIVEEQLREIREDLPKGYCRELPKLTRGDFAGYPRIYAVARAIIAHTDSRLENETLERFFRAYQKVTTLNICELWAIAITLRLALVENLRRLAERVVVSHEEREEADAFADELLELAGKQPDKLLPLVIKSLDKRKNFGHSFVARLTCRLREQDPAIAPVFEWLEGRLARQGKTTIGQIVHLEHQRQAAAQVTVGNIITSMRLLWALDWRAFFESVSLIDPLLKTDPARTYAKMNFATRNRYREIIERVARRTKTGELEVAERVVEFARRAGKTNPADTRRSHVGYYLIDEGLAELEKHFNYRPRFSELRRRFVLKHPTKVYLGLLSIITALLIAALVLAAAYSGASAPLLIVFALLSLIPASDSASNVLNWDFTFLIPPRLLPQMSADRAIPAAAAAAQTFVVIPTLLTCEAVVEELLEKLEVYCLADQDENIYFAILGDYANASAEGMPAETGIFSKK